MEIQFKPYGMMATLDGASDAQEASSITLKDTAGTPLKCNFVSVEASGENHDAYFRLAIESASQTTPIGGYCAASGAVGTTSGIVGGYASVNKGVVELLLADVDRSDTIELAVDQAGATNFFITYGQIQSGNRLRGNERPAGS